jgi:S1-C subfamily serine protease
MATTTWATILSLVLLAGSARAGAPESDPARRSRVVEAVERASPAVVNISTEQVVVQRGTPFGGDPFFDQFFRDFFDSRPRRSTRTSLGSGVIVQSDGTILGERLEAARGAPGVVLSLGRGGRRYDVQVPLGQSRG